MTEYRDQPKEKESDRPEAVNHQAVLRRGFATLLDGQDQLQQRMGWPSGKGLVMAKDNLLHTHAEVDEILAEINWKPHKRHLQEHGTLKNRARFITEITDAFQTLTNVALAYDVTADELAEALILKWRDNYHKIETGEVMSG